MSRIKIYLAEPPFDLREEFRSDLVTGVSLNFPETALLIIMLEETLAGLLELLKSLLPGVDRVIFPLGEWLAGHVVFVGDLRCVEGRVIYSA